MKFASYLNNGNEQLACVVDGYLYDMETLHPDLPGTMSMFLNYWEDVFPAAVKAEQAIFDGRIDKGTRHSNGGCSAISTYTVSYKLQRCLCF